MELSDVIGLPVFGLLQPALSGSPGPWNVPSNTWAFTATQRLIKASITGILRDVRVFIRFGSAADLSDCFFRYAESIKVTLLAGVSRELPLDGGQIVKFHVAVGKANIDRTQSTPVEMRISPLVVRIDAHLAGVDFTGKL